jgi:hypothetical protein
VSPLPGKCESFDVSQPYEPQSSVTWRAFAFSYLYMEITEEQLFIFLREKCLVGIEVGFPTVLTKDFRDLFQLLCVNW